MATKLDLAFYDRDATVVAPELLGKVLVRKINQDYVRARIVETEAYLGENDAASHAYRGLTKRNKIMFGPSGHIYIYFTYGMHFCMNVVTAEEGTGQAVLLRALEPLTGLEVMQANRGRIELATLTNGPAKLAQAFGIGPDCNGLWLMTDQIWIEDDGQRPAIARSPRIGISRATHDLLRFFVPDSSFVSKPNKNRYTTS